MMLHCMWGSCLFGSMRCRCLSRVRRFVPSHQGMTLIDTPGVLSGEKQRLKRGYEFEAVVKWLSIAEHIILCSSCVPAWCGMVWHDMVRHGRVWYGMDWNVVNFTVSGTGIA